MNTLDEEEAKNRVPTFIDGFDISMEGGVPKGYVVLISGQPGTMKSSIAFNALYKNAKNRGAHSLYVTLEQSRKNMIHHLGRMGMDYDEVKDFVSIVDLGLMRKKMENLDSNKTAWMELFKMYVKNLKDTMGYEILVVDSLPVLEIMAKFDDKRTEMFKMFEWFRDLGITTFLVSEVSSNPDVLYDENYLADGVISLRKERVGKVATQRHIIIDKRRATNHNTEHFMLMFKKGVFQVTQVITE